MEFGAKEILIAFGALVLIAIVLDFIKRMRAARYEKIRMPRRKQPVFDSDQPVDEYGSELPSGGARVVAYRDLDQQTPKQDIAPEKAVISQEVEQKAERLEEPETVPEIKPEKIPEKTPKVETPAARKPEQTSLNLSADQEKDDTEESSEPEQVMVIHLMAEPGSKFQGEALKDALLEQGLRFGAMKIFHRHEKTSGSGEVLFSVANLVNPGTFDLNTMDEFVSPGVALFFSCDSVKDPQSAFELMLETAEKLAEQLQGVLKDESRNVLTRQTVEHYRQKISDSLRTRLAKNH